MPPSLSISTENMNSSSSFPLTTGNITKTMTGTNSNDINSSNYNISTNNVTNNSNTHHQGIYCHNNESMEDLKKANTKREDTGKRSPSSSTVFALCSSPSEDIKDAIHNTFLSKEKEDPQSNVMLSDDSEKYLLLYVYDYLMKKSYFGSAKVFLEETNLDPLSLSTIPMSSHSDPSSFLKEWWNIFWDIYQSKQRLLLVNKSCKNPNPNSNGFHSTSNEPFVSLSSEEKNHSKLSTPSVHQNLVKEHHPQKQNPPFQYQNPPYTQQQYQPLQHHPFMNTNEDFPVRSSQKDLDSLNLEEKHIWLNQLAQNQHHQGISMQGVPVAPPSSSYHHLQQQQQQQQHHHHHHSTMPAQHMGGHPQPMMIRHQEDFIQQQSVPPQHHQVGSPMKRFRQEHSQQPLDDPGPSSSPYQPQPTPQLHQRTHPQQQQPLMMMSYSLPPHQQPIQMGHHHQTGTNISSQQQQQMMIMHRGQAPSRAPMARPPAPPSQSQSFGSPPPGHLGNINQTAPPTAASSYYSPSSPRPQPSSSPGASGQHLPISGHPQPNPQQQQQLFHYGQQQPPRTLLLQKQQPGQPINQFNATSSTHQQPMFQNSSQQPSASATARWPGGPQVPQGQVLPMIVQPSFSGMIEFNQQQQQQLAFIQHQQKWQQQQQQIRKQSSIGQQPQQAQQMGSNLNHPSLNNNYQKSSGKDKPVHENVSDSVGSGGVPIIIDNIHPYADGDSKNVSFRSSTTTSSSSANTVSPRNNSFHQDMGGGMDKSRKASIDTLQNSHQMSSSFVLQGSATTSLLCERRNSILDPTANGTPSVASDDYLNMNFMSTIVDEEAIGRIEETLLGDLDDLFFGHDTSVSGSASVSSTTVISNKDHHHLV